MIGYPMSYYYCRKCRALVHETEVDQENLTHTVMGFLTSDGQEQGIIHTGLTEED